MKALRLGLSSLMRCLLQTALRSSPARCRDRRFGPEAKGDGRILGAGLLGNHSRRSGIPEKQDSGGAPLRAAPPRPGEKAQPDDRRLQPCGMAGGWSATEAEPKNRYCRQAALQRLLQMAPAPAGAASLRRSGRHRFVGDWAGWVASPNPDKADSPRYSESPLIWLELVPKTAKRCRLQSWEGLRAHRPLRGANSDRRHSSGRPCDFHTGVIGAAMASPLP